MAQVPGRSYRQPLDDYQGYTVMHEIRLPPPSDTAIVLEGEEEKEEEEKQELQQEDALKKFEQMQALQQEQQKKTLAAQSAMYEADRLMVQGQILRAQIHTAENSVMQAATMENEAIHKFPKRAPYVVPPVLDASRRMKHNDSPYGPLTLYGPVEPGPAQIAELALAQNAKAKPSKTAAADRNLRKQK